MEVIGKIQKINDMQTFGTKGFRKREVVVLTNEQYPQPILVEFVQDKCDLLNNYSVGQDVKISINLRGREWTSPQGEVKYFNSVQGWKIEGLSSAPNTNIPPIDASDAFETTDNINDSEPDDLPF